MAYAPTAVDIEPPFGPAVVKRGLGIRAIVKTQSATSGLVSAKDISSSRWTYRLRTWTADDDTAVLSDSLIVKGTDAASGELDYYHTCGATVRDTLRWEIVEVDNSNADANTLSGYRELILWPWYQPIIDAP